MIARTFPLVLTVSLLSACTVGPDYQGAPDVAPKTLAAGQLPHADKVTSHAPAVAQWWQSLGDQQLNALIDGRCKTART